MPKLEFRGVYVGEASRLPPTIPAAPTSVAAFIGQANRGPLRPTLVMSLTDYRRAFGTRGTYLPAAIAGFFGNGGKRAWICRLTPRRSLAVCLAGLEAGACREVALVAAPGLGDAVTAAALIAHCEAHGRFAILDPPRGDPGALDPRTALPSNNAAFYAPWLKTAEGVVPPSGHVLGAYARTDDSRGVWKAPANEPLIAVIGPDHTLTRAAQEALNLRGVNIVGNIPGRGTMIWGARTLSNDGLWKYVSVRRLFLFLQRSIDEGLQWVLFEPNGESLWATVRGAIWNFLTSMWRQGALMGTTAEKAFYVRCDRSTMTRNDIDNGRLIVEIGFAPLRPAEFVIFRLGLWTADAGQDA